MDLLGRDLTFAALSKGSKFVSRRHQLLAENVANVNTAGYKRRDLDTADFTRMLADSLSSGSRTQRLEELDQVVAREVVQEQLFQRPDHNGVDLAYEQEQVAETSSMGAVISALMAKRIQMYKSVLHDGRV
ncbi:hypothetical protein IT575_07785 [bacterium]|nr:hypothetical protein [bacterium]